MTAAPELLEWARVASERYMHALGRRRDHVRQVAALADQVGYAYADDHELLTAAALVHDIGYSSELALTGFHPLDGARLVRRAGHKRLARLVAHHSGARIEAGLRGIDGYEDEFPWEDSELDQALTYCDLTTGPDGRRVTLEDRVEEIQERYGADHVVARAMRRGMPEFEQAREETECRIAEAGIVLTGSLAYAHSDSP